MHKIDMVMDFQFGSTGKGLIAGFLAKRQVYDTVVCAYGANAGHTYIDKSRDLRMVTRQLPIGITSDSARNILIGPGAIIDPAVLEEELFKYDAFMKNKRLLIHPQAAIITEEHVKDEAGLSRIGSTTKGVGEAMIQRMRRNPDHMNTAGFFLQETALEEFVCTTDEYMDALEYSDAALVEGAQGYSLSMYHGFYPYVTARDVTPWQIAADCGLPFKWAPYIQVIGTMRTYPIRVNNRTGTSGPCYWDQNELKWEDVGVEPELTTVTKLPRRVFTFSQQQALEASWHCGGYWDTKIFLNFANYLKDREMLDEMVGMIETPRPFKLNPPKVVWTGWGPDDADIQLYRG